jgi:hypothetical protein
VSLKDFPWGIPLLAEGVHERAVGDRWDHSISGQCAVVLDGGDGRNLRNADPYLEAKVYALQVVGADGDGCVGYETPVLRMARSHPTSLQWQAALENLRDEDVEAAIERGKAFQATGYDGPEVGMGLGALLERQGKYREAMDIYRAMPRFGEVIGSTTYRDWDPGWRSSMARCYDAIGDTGRAARLFLQASSSPDLIKWAASREIDLEKVALGQLVPLAGGRGYNILHPCQAVLRLGDVGAQAAVEVILKYLNTHWCKDEVVRATALTALAAVVDRCLQGNDPKVQRIESMLCDEARSPLSWIVRRGASRALLHLESPKVEAVLREQLDDPVTEVVNHAVESLQKLGAISKEEAARRRIPVIH